MHRRRRVAAERADASTSKTISRSRRWPASSIAASWDATRMPGRFAMSSGCSTCLPSAARRPRSSRSAGSPSATPAGPAHRRRGARTGQPWLRPPSRQRSEPQRVRADVRRAKSLLEDLGGRPVRGYRAPSFSIGECKRLGLRRSARGRLSLQLQRLPGSARPLRHARCAPVRLRRSARPARDSVDDHPPSRPQSPSQRRRLLSLGPLSAQSVGDSPRQLDRSAGGHLLHAPLGDRSRAAARARYQLEDAVSPLRQPRQDRSSTEPTAARLSLGPDRRGLRASRCREPDRRPRWPAATAVSVRRVPRIRPCAVGRIRLRLPRGRHSFTASAGARSTRKSFAIARTTCLPNAASESSACLPLVRAKEPAVRSRVGLPALRCLRRCRRHGQRGDAGAASPSASSSDAQLGVEHLELRNIARDRAGMATAGAIRHVSQASACPRQRPTCSRSRASSGPWCARASSANSEAKSTPASARFFDLYADNMHRHGTPPHSRRYFETLQRVFGRRLRGPHGVQSRKGKPSHRRAVVLFSRRGAALLRRRLGRCARTRCQRLQVLGADAACL